MIDIVQISLEILSAQELEVFVCHRFSQEAVFTLVALPEIPDCRVQGGSVRRGSRF